MTKVERWQTTDGKVFSIEAEAEQHQDEITTTRQLERLIEFQSSDFIFENNAEVIAFFMKNKSKILAIFSKK